MAKFSVDFSGVTDGFSLPPEGDYVCKVKSVELKDGKTAKYLKWTLVIGTGPSKGSKLFHNTSFSPNALFGLRNFLIACGQNVPKQAFQVNTDLCINQIVGVSVVHQEYEKKDGSGKGKSANVNEVYRVIKTEKGFVRFDADKQASTAIENDMAAQHEEEAEEVPFDLDNDEIDI